VKFIFLVFFVFSSYWVLISVVGMPILRSRGTEECTDELLKLQEDNVVYQTKILVTNADKGLDKTKSSASKLLVQFNKYSLRFGKGRRLGQRHVSKVQL
jgi:hypothetical protein